MLSKKIKKILLVIFTFFQYYSNAQFTSKTTPKIEPCECKFKADSTLITKCGYLLVPENRNNTKSKTIKLPYIYVQSANKNKKSDPVLYTTGGPGGSSLASVESIHYFEFMKDRDFIAFEQRGTKYALPCLECEEINDATKQSYKKNLSKDSLINIATLKCRKRLLAKEIDITGYNTAENTEDIEDLRRLLKIDSLNLIGVSYSGGLMLNVLRKYPNHIRSLVLDSPLPLFINIDEEELANFNEVLHQIFVNENSLSLEEKLNNYLIAIEKKTFITDYFDEKQKKTFKINYGRNELIDIIGSKIGDENDRKIILTLATDFINGNHKTYITEYLADVFNDNSVYSGMRLSVYCSDKIAYANQNIAKQQYIIFPQMAGYKANDVSIDMCKCWNVPAIKPEHKKPFYSNIPILLGAGYFDPATRPVYNDLLHHYFPKSQRLLFMNKAHGPLISLEGNSIIGEFLNNPFRKVELKNNEIKSF